MKRIIFVIAILGFMSCNGKKDKKVKEDSQVTKKVVVEKEYPEANIDVNELEFIFNDGFTFSEGITVDQIGILKLKEDTYKIVYFLNDDSNFETIEDLNVAFRVYPTSAEVKPRTIAAKSNISILDNSKVIVFDDFTISHKDFDQVKVYFYNPKAGVVGKMMTILKVTLQK